MKVVRAICGELLESLRVQDDVPFIHLQQSGFPKRPQRAVYVNKRHPSRVAEFLLCDWQPEAIPVCETDRPKPQMQFTKKMSNPVRGIPSSNADQPLPKDRLIDQ